VDLAGLTNGKLYGIRVPEFPISPSDGKSREPTGTQPLSATVGKYGPFRFELRLLNGDGDVRNLPQVENVSDSAGVSICRLKLLFICYNMEAHTYSNKCYHESCPTTNTISSSHHPLGGGKLRHISNSSSTMHACMHAYMINYACMLQIPHSSCKIIAIIMALYRTAGVSFNR